MLKNTFCHIPGVGFKTEQQLWDSGIHDWDTLVNSHGKPSFRNRGKIRALKLHIDESLAHLQNNNPQFFSQLLPGNQHWRLFPEFRESAAYLDIETTGLGAPTDYITTISLYDGESIKYYIKGDNLNRFVKDIQGYSVVVTYNGKCFDVPFIQRVLRAPMDQVHIDLRYLLKRYRSVIPGKKRKHPHLFHHRICKDKQ